MPAASRTTLVVLVVDDDLSAAKALGRLVRVCGHTVHISHTAREGFDIALRVKPDLILHDLALPDVDGHDAARRLRESPVSGTVLIACSGSVDEEKARAAGFDGWLVKPIADGDFDAVLARVLERINRCTEGNVTDPARGAAE